MAVIAQPLVSDRILQSILARVLPLHLPPPKDHLGPPRIAVIGAGRAGVGAAAECVGHGFDTTIFEAASRDERRVVERYGLAKHTKFETSVTQVSQDGDGKWIINDTSGGPFDGIIVATGECSETVTQTIRDQSKFNGGILQTSQLAGKQAKGKAVIVVGESGAQGLIDALEFVAAQNVEKTYVLTSSVGPFFSPLSLIHASLSLQALDTGAPLSWVVHNTMHLALYLAVKGLDLGRSKPARGTSAAIVDYVRSGKVKRVDGSLQGFNEDGICFGPKSKDGVDANLAVDTCIMANGTARPSLQFLPGNVLEEPYERQHWYLQAFPPKQRDICAVNCLSDPKGPLGTYRVGVYTRFLLMLLLDPLARPSDWWVQKCIDMQRWIASRVPSLVTDSFAPIGLLSLIVLAISTDPFRWKWTAFVLFGSGAALPESIVHEENEARVVLRATEKSVNIARWISSQAPRSITAFLLYSDLLFLLTVGLAVRFFRGR